MSEKNLPDRLENWRYPMRDSVRVISPEVAECFFSSSGRGGADQMGIETIRKLSDEDRMILWATVFPGLKDEVELAWHHLDPHTIARRDGEAGGRGTSFHFSLTPVEADLHLLTWLRKLLIYVGPYPELGLTGLMEWPGALVKSKGGLFSGEHYDSDTLGYLTSVVLTRNPESELAIRLVDFFEEQLQGKKGGRDTHCVFTAVFCADRPDLWRRFNRLLIGTAMEPAFFEELLWSREGVHPGAYLDFLKTIRDHQLLRFPQVYESLVHQFEDDWQWITLSRDDFQPWFDRWVEQIELAGNGVGVLPQEAGQCFLALWAEAFRDGDSAVARVLDSSGFSPEMRIAAVQFLRLCPLQNRRKATYHYLTDPDLRVANLASQLVSHYGSRSLNTDELPVVFERLRIYLGALPAKPTLEAYPRPFSAMKLDLGGLDEAVATSFPDGAETEIEALLPKLGNRARFAVIERLNRYRLSEDDLEYRRIAFSDDPEGLKEWLKDQEGTQSNDQRRLLLKILSDRNLEVAESAFKAVSDFDLEPDELKLLSPILKGKSAKKRLLATQLISRQSRELLRKFIPHLLGSRSAGERLAGIEVLRQVGERDETAELASEILSRSNYSPGTREETRAFEVLSNVVAPISDAEVPGLGNAFGLVDRESLAEPDQARELEVIVHSPVTVRLLEELDKWLQERADVMIPSTRVYISDEPERLGDVQIPSPGSSSLTTKDREEQIARFPPAVELAEWWVNRPDELRDPDGFELVRLEFAAERFVGDSSSPHPTMRTVVFGGQRPPTIQKDSYSIRNLCAWIRFLSPVVYQSEELIDYLLDCSETVLARLPKDQLNWSLVFGDRLNRLIDRKQNPKKAHLKRIWNLTRNRAHDEPRILRFYAWRIVYFFQEGILSEDEFIWFFVGERPFGKHDIERAFNSLGEVTSPSGHYPNITGFASCQQALGKISDRVVELELSRGEEPEVWSYAALSLQVVYGAGHLQRVLLALGKAPFRRPANERWGKKNLTRTSVLIHLIQVSAPAQDDTPESFASLMKEAAIPTERLLELTLMRPAWVPFVVHATGIEGLRDAVAWIYAHTRSSDYQWESQSKELWTSELGFDTALTADELLEGAVDFDWFHRAYKGVGKKVWEILAGAAKFASSNNGHARARLFADALLGKLSVPELQKRIVEKGDLNAARAIGLLPLPKSGKRRQSDLLKRYGVLQQLRVVARKSKTQRRASEIAAYEIGVRNLARGAGSTDTVRFEWAMERETVADLTRETLQASIDDLECTIVIQPDGTLKMKAERAGKSLARVPAAVKKDAGFQRLKQRMDELKEQAARLRPALEDLMVRAVVLPVSEWRNILAHPLTGPLIGRLLLFDGAGLIGFPTEQGLRAYDGEVVRWPKDDVSLKLAHPNDLLPAEEWHHWQRFVFDEQIVQPFKQIFRELYLPVGEEKTGPIAGVNRFSEQQVQSHQALAILGKRGWVSHPDDGLYRLFRTDGICAWLSFKEAYRGFSDYTELTVQTVNFTSAGKHRTSMAPQAVPDRVFSEASRDLDLIVSVAHVTGAVPEAGSSSMKMRSNLIRETCRNLEIENVILEERHARIEGALGNYRVHLGSGVVHREPGGMIAMRSEVQNERGRIFLPFADDDPQGIEVLSRVLLFSKDEKIRDPKLAALLRSE